MMIQPTYLGINDEIIGRKWGLNVWDMVKTFLHCALTAAQCIVIGPVCLCVVGWVCYRDNSKLRGSAAGRTFLAPPYYSQCAVFAYPPSAFFISNMKWLNEKRVIRNLVIWLQPLRIRLLHISYLKNWKLAFTDRTSVAT